MTFYDKFLKSPSFVDCVTHSNLVLYIVLKEYICSIKLDESMFADTDEDEDRVNLYMSLYNILKEMPLNSFECLSTSAHKLPRRLQALTRGRIERLRNTFEAVQYTHPKSLKESVFSSGLSLENEEKFIVTKDSVFGLFLRKFALGFHHQSFEEMTKFLDSFFEAYDAELVGSFDLGKSDDSFTNRSDLYPVSTRNRAQDISSQIASCMGRIGGRPTVGPRKIDEMLELSKKLFPELPTPHYTSHLLATKKRNFTEAEKELHAYFETRMSSDESSKNLSNTCAYMAIAAATMHLSFGHWSKGNQLEKEALKKALESESKTPLKHVQIAHTLLNPSTEPFRYDGQISVKNHYRSMSVAFAELRTKFWDMVDKGSPPDQLLAFYFNSPVATSPTYFAPCLFDLASLWSLYGYPILSTALLQCVINADCLQPCPTSDAVLSAAFACMIREISSEGAEVTALKLAKACEAVLCRFSEKSAIRQASLLVELEAGLRSKVDLPKCDRLVNAIRLCCPWEAALWPTLRGVVGIC
ncbi:unnamed protein product [Calicophoron daubneyi]|uniref:Anaphase-promoting complex subunit 5 n=1 Tax=Calicophoron daubneyi TaxID=300641 RepID=A0AAV2THT8_CALDB